MVWESGAVVVECGGPLLVDGRRASVCDRCDECDVGRLGVHIEVECLQSVQCIARGEVISIIMYVMLN